MKPISALLAMVATTAMLTTAASASTINFTTDQREFDTVSTEVNSDDFEDLGVPAGGVTTLTSPLVRNGVTYTPSSDVMVGLGAGLIGVTTTVAPNQFAATIDLSFEDGISTFGAELLSNSVVSVLVSVFDAADSLLGQTTVSVSTTATFFGVLSDMNIARISFDDQNTSAGGPIFDNVSIGTIAAVPLPAGGFLLLTVLAGAGVASRKRTA